MDTEKLTWAFWNGTHWDPVESTLTEDNVLEADTDHFSVWIVTEVQEVIIPEEPVGDLEPEDTGGSQIPIPTLSIAVGITIVVLILMRKSQ